jgi:hypothetical protein
MTRQRSTRADLLDRLREGPLASEEWPDWAASRKSLHVRIKVLRRLGYTIATRQERPPTWRLPNPPVAYRLVAEPGELLEAAA